MASFWGLFLLAGYGILGGFVNTANSCLSNWFGIDTTPWYRPVPILGEFGPGALIAVILQTIVGFILYRILNRKKVVDYLIETEGEMRKVVWPNFKETRSGSIAVVITVVVMLAFLWVVDNFFLEAFQRLFSINLGG